MLAETFLTAWRRLDQVPEGVETRLWLYGVARRTLANHRRREQRRSAATERLRAELASAPLAGHDDPPELATVGRALRSMPPNDQELLGLVAWEGLDNGEVAAVLGCSRNAARIRLHRARRRLERELRSAGGDAGERGQRGRTLSVAGPTTPTPEGDRL